MVQTEGTTRLRGSDPPMVSLHSRTLPEALPRACLFLCSSLIMRCWKEEGETSRSFYLVCSAVPPSQGGSRNSGSFQLVHDMCLRSVLECPHSAPVGGTAPPSISTPNPSHPPQHLHPSVVVLHLGWGEVGSPFPGCCPVQSHVISSPPEHHEAESPWAS